MDQTGVVPLTADMEFRLMDLYTAPVNHVPKRHSTMCGFIVREHWDLWELGLIQRVGSSMVRLTQLGRDSLDAD